VLPDYAQRMGSAGRVARGQILWLPVLTAAAALVASSLAQAPNLALYGVVAVGRGLHTSTFRLNLSRFLYKIHATHPFIPPDTPEMLPILPPNAPLSTRRR